MIQTFEGQTADEVWQQAAARFRRDERVRWQESRVGDTAELMHAGLSIADPTQRWVVSRAPAISPAFAIAEVVWVMRGRNDAAFLNYWNRQLPKFAGTGDTYHGAYGYRLRHKLGIDQLMRAYRALEANPKTRQIVLQIWDAEADMPHEDGTPRSPDVPCNVTALVKVRDEKLEWMQIIRSNDLYRGMPYNFVQFTYLQEILAGWLGVDIGSYNQVSDSLHVYADCVGYIQNSLPVEAKENTDTLRLGKEASMEVFSELERRIGQFAKETLSKKEHIRLAAWPQAPEGAQNMIRVLAAEAARRRRWSDIPARIMEECSNPALVQLWRRWQGRFQKEVVS